MKHDSCSLNIENEISLMIEKFKSNFLDIENIFLILE